MRTNAYAAQTATTPLAPFSFQRRDVGNHDVQIDILYCGVCHSDLHTVRSEWQGTTYPCVPGHEIIGRVVRIGTDVQKIKVGDSAGVGCMVDSCRTCADCEADLEQFCDAQPLPTIPLTKRLAVQPMAVIRTVLLWMKPLF